MICPVCTDKGSLDSDMVHKNDVEAVHDPSEPSGYGERETHWFECQTCGHQEECDGRCKEPLDEL